eukprot:Gb_21315 [translate_table: standard]
MERSLGQIPPDSSVERERYGSREISMKSIDKDSSSSRGFLMDRGGNTTARAAETNQRGGPLLERFRAILRDREDDIERPRERLREDQIVSLYKNALGELTFNSKPIITDLTIIAGEHTHAAKGIAATVCAHITEVPNEQKLPSLYLLDSIVKNIGGDYVKYFAARLPEVFCKAYRQVDPRSYNAMQHLFRTWGGVFQPAPLRIIEAELQFPPAANGPSSGTASSRPPESQAQRPGHGIHVNPKYLEARQQFEQSSLAERANSENNGDTPSPETERSNRAMHESPKEWSEAPLRIHNDHRPERPDAFFEPGYGRKSSVGFSDYDFSLGDAPSPSRIGVGRTPSPLSRVRVGRAPSPSRVGAGNVPSPSRVGARSAPSPPPLRIGIGRVSSPSRIGVGRVPSPSRIGVGRLNDRIAEQDNGWQRPWYGKGDGDGLGQLENVNASVPYGQKNGYDWHQLPTHGALIDAYGNYRGQRSARGSLTHLQPRQEIDTRNSRMVSRNWQTSEEEEYMWEDMSPRLLDRGRENDNLRKGDCFPGDINKWSGLGRGKRMSLESGLPDRDWYKHRSLSHMDQPQMSGKDRLPLQRESEERQPSSLLQPGVGSRCISDTYTETSSLLQTGQGGLGSRYLPGRPPQLPHQNLSPASQSRLGALKVSVPGRSPSTGLVSLNLAQSGGHPLPSMNDSRSASTELPLGMVTKSRTNIGPSLGTDPFGSEFLSPVTPASSSMPFPQRQQPQRPISPSPIPPPLRHSMPQLPPLPPSAPPPQQAQFQLHHQNQNNYMKSSNLQAQVPSLNLQGQPSHSFQQSPHRSQPAQQIPQQLPQLQQVPLSQPAPELLNQVPHNLVQGGHVPQQLSIPQEIQQIQPAPFSQQSWSQPLMQSQPIQQSQLSYGPPQTLGSLMNGSVTNPNSGPTLGPALVSPAPSNFPSQVLGKVQPPLPPGPPPASSLVASTSQPTSSVSTLPSPVNPLSNLLSSLMAQGLISATTSTSSAPFLTTPVSSDATPNQLPGTNAGVTTISTTTLFPIPTLNTTPPEPSSAEGQSVQDPIGTTFTSEILRVRHESVLNELYGDLPRQCTTCGLRFKFQEEHSNHMDWHVSRNRTISKNRKQKSAQTMSRKWFVSAKEWLSGTEALTSEVVPAFSPVETTLDKKDNEEVAVPADESQSVCALCGELFDDFYSDETEEWMYKGAVYMNVPGGNTEGMDRSQLGPIVHAKCRSESVGVAFTDSEEDVSGR